MNKKPPISMWSKLAAQGLKIPISPKIYCSDIFAEAQKRPCDFALYVNAVPPFEEFWMEGHVRSGYSGGFIIRSWRPNKDRPTARILARILAQLIRLVSQSKPDEKTRLVELNRNRVQILHMAVEIAAAHHPEVFFDALCLMDEEGYDTAKGKSWLREHPIKPDSWAKNFPWEWIVDVTLFCDAPHSPPSRYADMIYAIDENGTVVQPERSISAHAIVISTLQTVSDNADTIALTVENAIALCSYAMSIMNCKNVFLEDIDTQPSKHHKKIECVKKIIFKVLTIDPMSKKHKKPSMKSNGTREKFTRLHLVRGHTADYRKGKGLFGRLNGVFFIPAHARGTTKHGIVIKDYKIESTEESEDSAP